MNASTSGNTWCSQELNSFVAADVLVSAISVRNTDSMFIVPIQFVLEIVTRPVNIIGIKNSTWTKNHRIVWGWDKTMFLTIALYG